MNAKLYQQSVNQGELRNPYVTMKEKSFLTTVTLDRQAHARKYYVPYVENGRTMCCSRNSLLFTTVKRDNRPTREKPSRRLEQPDT